MLGPMALALALSLSPPAAGNWALWAIGLDHETRDGKRTLGEQLERIAHRESVGKQGSESDVDAWRRSSEVGIHVRDAFASGLSWRNAVDFGRADPECQPRFDEVGREIIWSTRGPWGLMAGLHMGMLPACAQPHWFDVPLVSGIVAARKYRDTCEPQDRPRLKGWCKYS